jgi:NTE family protein
LERRCRRPRHEKRFGSPRRSRRRSAGFPAIEIEGEQYWDGGLVSNTPLLWIAMTQQRPPDSLVFQVDLWNARGEFPRNLAEVATRQKEMLSSSRTRAFTDYFKEIAKLRHMLAVLCQRK